MIQQRNTTGKKWIGELIRFFRQMPRKRPDATEVDYSGWHQSEEQYRKEQAEWLKQVEERKKEKRPGDDSSRE